MQILGKVCMVSYKCTHTRTAHYECNESNCVSCARRFIDLNQYNNMFYYLEATLLTYRKESSSLNDVYTEVYFFFLILQMCGCI